MSRSASNNPYGDTEMVSRLIGTAYDTVKTVRDNLQYIKHVSTNLPQIAIVSESITQLLAIYSQLAKLMQISDKLPEIVAVADNLVQINAVYNNLDNIETMVENLPALLAVLDQMDEILGAVAAAEAARDAAEQFAQDAFENATNIPIATEEEAIEHINSSKAMTPATTWASFEAWKDTINSLILRDETYAGIVGTNQTYTLEVDPGSPMNVFVYVGGVRQRPITDYNTSGTTLTIFSNPYGLPVDTLILAATAEIGLLNGHDSSYFATAVQGAKADTALQVDSFKQTEVKQSGAGLITTYPERPIEIISNEIPSIYGVIPESIRADIRTGLYSEDTSAFFTAMVDKTYPGGTNRPGGAKVRVPAGLYLVGGTGIPMQDAIGFLGETKEGTRMQAMGNNPVFRSVGTSLDAVGRASIENFTILGAGKGHLYGYGVELKRMHNPVVKGIQFQNLRWCIVQEYTVNALITECTSVGVAESIRGYHWMKATSGGLDNTTMMSDNYFMAGDIGLLLHGANGIQCGGNVNMLQCTNRIGAFAETLPDGTSFTPGASDDPIHFLHFDGFHTDSTSSAGAPAVHMLKGLMPDLHDIRFVSMWGGNIPGNTGSNGVYISANGVRDLLIEACQMDNAGQQFVQAIDCKTLIIKGNTIEKFGGGGAAQGIFVQNSKGVIIQGNTFRRHRSNAVGDMVRLQGVVGGSVANNYYDVNNDGSGGVSVTPGASVARRVILQDCTDIAVNGNTSSDRSTRIVETGASDWNRIADNPVSVTPATVGANTLKHHNDTAAT